MSIQEILAPRKQLSMTPRRKERKRKISRVTADKPSSTLSLEDGLDTRFIIVHIRAKLIYQSIHQHFRFPAHDIAYHTPHTPISPDLIIEIREDQSSRDAEHAPLMHTPLGQVGVGFPDMMTSLPLGRESHHLIADNRPNLVKLEKHLYSRMPDVELLAIGVAVGDGAEGLDLQVDARILPHVGFQKRGDRSNGVVYDGVVVAVVLVISLVEDAAWIVHF